MESQAGDAQRGLAGALAGDGRPLLVLVALSLMLAGGFAIFQCATGHFLPHDVQFLGMEKAQLCGLSQCRIVHFMFHDRVSFGGAIIAIGWLYLWLAEFPLRRGESWAWWAFLLSGVLGFGSFLAYLGYGYLDSWHGMATLFLLIPFVWGLVRTRRMLSIHDGPGSLLRHAARVRYKTTVGLGRVLLLATGAGMIAGGLTIMLVGMTSVFVPQDLVFMGLNPAQLHAINPRLIPLIAHDRAGFGGGVATCGLLFWLCVWRGEPTRALWQALALAGGTGFVCAIGIHPVIGYLDFTHLAPAYTGALIFVIGLSLSWSPMRFSRGIDGRISGSKRLEDDNR